MILDLESSLQLRGQRFLCNLSFFMIESFIINERDES